MNLNEFCEISEYHIPPWKLDEELLCHFKPRSVETSEVCEKRYLVYGVNLVYVLDTGKREHFLVAVHSGKQEKKKDAR